MDKKKKISINPAFFKIKKKKKEKKKKPTLNTSLKINNVKRAFMERIKHHQGGTTKKKTNDDKHDFKSSLEYLENISKKEGGKRERKKRMKEKSNDKNYGDWHYGNAGNKWRNIEENSTNRYC